MDCSVKGMAGGFLNAINIVDLVKQLAADYGITVSVLNGADTSAVIPSFAIQFGETPASIIDRSCRAAKLLCYEGTDGNLVLSAVSKQVSASGVAYGNNAQSWSVRNSMAERYSEIKVQQLGLDTLSDQGQEGLLFAAMAPDHNVPRFRLLYTVGENLDYLHCGLKAQWEVNRRAGRGTIVSALVDGWRDASGALWTPNTLIPCTGPGLRYTGHLCISSVTFSYDDSGGKTATITALPPYAFAPEPIQLQPVTRDVNANDGSGLEPLS